MSARRVVVVGNGMVGSRFAADLTARDPDVHVTVLGGEGHRAYNRVLLSDVVAGTAELAGLELPTAEGADTLLDTSVVAIDRDARCVLTESGSHPYDALVLATGAQPRVPSVEGLAEPHDLPIGAHALRTLDDAREIVAATANARHAVVIGGGVLGLEVASGLARRGLSVQVLHAGGVVMDRQLDGTAAEVVADALRALGVEVLTSTTTRRILLAHGRVRGVEVETGDAVRTLPADLLVLACGTVPETALAAAAGLPVDRGVLVGADLASPADTRVFAIGDCAQPPEGGSGLLAQGWDQARRLAEALANGQQRPAETSRPSVAVRLSQGVVSRPSGGGPASADVAGTDIVRAKIKGVDIVAMGVCGSARVPDPRQRSVRLTDPHAGRHVEVVIAGDRLVGATCVGAPEVAADLSASYTRRLPVPADPAHLLLRPAPGMVAAAPTPEAMPEATTVCTCNGVTKGEIAACVHEGASSVAEVARATRATTGCGSCREAVCGLLDWLGASQPGSTAREVGVTAGQSSTHGVETRRG